MFSKNQKAYQKYVANITQKMTIFLFILMEFHISDHQSIITKAHKLTQPTKKLDCPMTFQVKNILRFPEFKIDTDTKCYWSVASMKLRNSLQQIPTYLINRMKFCVNIY